jgi:HSP20 family molecular chaperone IbpA
MFYNHFGHAIVREKATLSAKWRRNKKRSDWFNIYKATKRDGNKKASQAFRIKNIESKRRASSPSKFRVMKISKSKKLKEPEPLIDILQEKDEVVIVAEVARFNKETLKIHVKNQRLILSAEASDRKYYKSLNLPIGVIPDNIRTAYKNGVLEIRLKKTIEEKAVDRVAG